MRAAPDPTAAAARALSGRALAAAYALAVALPLVLAAADGIPPEDVWTEAATGAGLAGAVMLMLQMVSSGRFRSLSGRIGIDVTMGFHRWAAPLGLALALAHVLALAGPWDPSDPARAGRRLAALLTAPGLRNGVAALGLALVLALTARFRHRLPLPYELWRASHALMALAFVGLLARHILDRGTHAAATPARAFWIALALGVVLPMALMHGRRLRDHLRHRWRLESVRPRGERLWELILAPATGRPLPFRAGQFGWLATRPRWLPIGFDHPFSIASAPGGDGRLRLLVAEAGDFTSRIGALEPGRAVGFDAPHGNFTVAALGEGVTGLVLIAGGVGVAPILALLEDLAQRGERRSVRVILAARSPAALVDPALTDPPLAALGARVIRLVDRDAGGDLRPGPLTPAHLAEALAGLDPATTGALICGPPGLTTAAADGLAALGVPLDRIHYERFDYAATFAAQKDRRVLRRFRALGAAAVLAAAAFALR